VEDLPPFEYHRDDARRRIRITAREPLQGGDLTSIVDRQAREDTWTFAVLYDLRATHGATLRADAIAVAEHVRRYVDVHGARGPVALVTRRIDMVAAGQIYALDGAKRGFSVEVFWDLDEADRWLDERQVKQP
jgi:hypothetical protein